MTEISTALRKKFFDLLSRNSSPDFMKYLRAYEGIVRPPRETFEVSCELVNGMRVDRMRLAIEGLRRVDVLTWLSSCRRRIPLIQDLLYQNPTDPCFGIGLADYSSGQGVCRMKIYNFYGSMQAQEKKVGHVEQSLALLNIPDGPFKKDLKRFEKVEFSGVDWDREGQATLKVYFGLFPMERLFSSFGAALSKKELLCYDVLRKNEALAEKFLCCVRYSPNGRSLRLDWRYQTRRLAGYLKIFDRQDETARFVADFFQLFNDLKLEYISMQWSPVRKMQFYFNFNPGRYMGKKHG